MLIGSLVMVVTGLILYFPLLFTRLFPGEMIPVAQVAHSNEGLMAFLVVITWHIYNAHLSPTSSRSTPASSPGRSRSTGCTTSTPWNWPG